MLLRNSGVLWRELDGEAVLLDPQEGCSYNLNRVGTFIWKILDGMHSIEEIASALCEAYEVDYPEALRDVEHLVDELRAQKLLGESLAPSRPAV
jgi:Coenzyme PQQ synthesis protein D (PqqD)